MFEGVRERAPCILCLEDVDSMVTEEVRSTFLNEGVALPHARIDNLATPQVAMAVTQAGVLDAEPFRPDPVFGVEVPAACPGVPSEVLHQRATWPDDLLRLAAPCVPASGQLPRCAAK